MNTLITILNKPNQTFEYLEKKYEDVSNPDYDVIFMLLGAFSGLILYLKDYESINNFFNLHPAINGLFTMLLGAGIGYVLCKHIIGPITYWIGKALKGQADKEQIIMVIAYSLIPVFFRMPFEIYYIMSYNSSLNVIIYWITTGIAILIIIWSVIIEIKGLMFFNKYGLLRAIINKLPFFIFQGGFIYWTQMST
jgi:hypothetical protein